MARYRDGDEVYGLAWLLLAYYEHGAGWMICSIMLALAVILLRQSDPQ